MTASTTALSADEKAAVVIQDALDLINDGGMHWTKGTYRREIGGEYSYCAVGALRQAAYGDVFVPFGVDPEVHRTFNRAYQAVRRQLDQPIIFFNDSTKTTFKDVERVFKAAIKYLRGK